MQVVLQTCILMSLLHFRSCLSGEIFRPLFTPLLMYACALVKEPVTIGSSLIVL
jgi:hypothetical protein